MLGPYECWIFVGRQVLIDRIRQGECLFYRYRSWFGLFSTSSSDFESILRLLAHRGYTLEWSRICRVAQWHGGTDRRIYRPPVVVLGGDVRHVPVDHRCPRRICFLAVGPFHWDAIAARVCRESHVLFGVWIQPIGRQRLVAFRGRKTWRLRSYHPSRTVIYQIIACDRGMTDKAVRNLRGQKIGIYANWIIKLHPICIDAPSKNICQFSSNEVIRSRCDIR